MSLKANKAKLAEEHNMEETRFMQEFPIKLLATPDAKGKLTKSPLKHEGKILYEEVYEWKEVREMMLVVQLEVVKEYL